MTLKEFKNNYLITDGEILSLLLEYDSNNSKGFDSLILRINGKKLNTKGEFENSIFSLEFKILSEFYYNEKFDSKTISQSTLTKTTLSRFYLSLDPFREDNPSDDDNMVIESQELFLIDASGIKNQII